MTVSAINTFRLRPGVPVADFEHTMTRFNESAAAGIDPVVTECVDGRVAGPGPDRFVSPDLEAATDLVLSGAIAAAAVAAASTSSEIHATSEATP